MKSKNFVLIITMLLCATFTFAQTGAGNLMLGGTAGFDVEMIDGSDDNLVTIELNPMLGFFIIDNLAVGATLQVSSAKQGDHKNTGFGIAPFGRYYIGPGGIKLFVHAQFGYASYKFEDGGFELESKGSLLTIGPGLAFFLNDHVAIEALLAYDKGFGDLDGSSNIGLGIGVQAYLGGNE